jgi:hypothetical protein
MSIFNKHILPDQQFAELTTPGPWPLQAGVKAPPAPDDYPSMGVSQGNAAVMADAEIWDPESDVNPPETFAARLYVPMAKRVPSSPPPRPIRLENPADETNTRIETPDHELHVSLAFPCHSVIVDNYTNQWLWFPSARRWVPPYLFGVILPLLQATGVAEYLIQAPPTFTQAALHATQYITTEWTAQLLQPSAGTAIAGGVA